MLIFNLINLATVESLIIHFGYFLILPLAILEGPIITIMSAFLAYYGYLNVFIVYLVVVVGDVVGDIIFYYIGYFAKNRIMKRRSFLGVKVEQLVLLENHFNKHTGKTILFGKFTHSAGFAILISAGMARVSFNKFFWWNLLGTLPKSLLFVLIGYYFGKSYNSINTYLDYTSFILFFIILFFALLYFFLKYRKNKIS